LPMVFILIWVVVKSFIPSAGDPSTVRHSYIIHFIIK
jgi:hypothetical protein